jgi:hypothetical protein
VGKVKIRKNNRKRNGRGGEELKREEEDEKGVLYVTNREKEEG